MPLPSPESVLNLLTQAMDLRERETAPHSTRIDCHAVVLARRFYHEPDALTQIYRGALLHDLGMIGIPDAILLKRDALSTDEWKIKKTHPTLRYELINQDTR